MASSSNKNNIIRGPSDREAARIAYEKRQRERILVADAIPHFAGFDPDVNTNLVFDLVGELSDQAEGVYDSREVRRDRKTGELMARDAVFITAISFLKARRVEMTDDLKETLKLDRFLRVINAVLQQNYFQHRSELFSEALRVKAFRDGRGIVFMMTFKPRPLGVVSRALYSGVSQRSQQSQRSPSRGGKETNLKVTEKSFPKLPAKTKESAKPEQSEEPIPATSSATPATSSATPATSSATPATSSAKAEKETSWASKAAIPAEASLEKLNSEPVSDWEILATSASEFLQAPGSVAAL